MKNEGILGFADPDLIDSPTGSSGFPIGRTHQSSSARHSLTPNGKLSTEQWAATFLGHKKKVDGSSNPAFLKLEAYEGYPKLVIDDSQL